MGPLSLVTKTLQRPNAAGSSGSAILSTKLTAQPPQRFWTRAITSLSSGPPKRRISQGYLSFSIPMSCAKPSADQRFVAQTDPGCNEHGTGKNSCFGQSPPGRVFLPKTVVNHSERIYGDRGPS